MERGERGMEDYANFKFPDEIPNQEMEKQNDIEIAELEEEIKLEVMEIKPADIEGIEKQMEREKKREGLKGGQRVAFEGAALERLRKEAPEAGIEKVKLSEEDIRKCKERMAQDIEGAIKAKTEKVKEDWTIEKRKSGRIQTDEDTPDEKVQLAERIREEIKSEQVWIREFQTSYLKEVLDEKEFKESGLELTEKEWKDMVSDLRNLIHKKDWHKVIPRMGHMNNLDPVKFGEVSRSLFDSDDKEGMLQHIEELKGDEAAGKKTNEWELASRIRYVSECFPELRSRIKLSEENWKKMNKFLKEAREKKWDVKEQENNGVEGDYWKVAYQECNMKVIENMVNRGEVRAVKKIEQKNPTVE